MMKCYVCGRTEKDMDFLTNKQFEPPFYTKEFKVGRICRAVGGEVPEGMYHKRFDVSLCPVCYGLISTVAGSVAREIAN